MEDKYKERLKIIIEVTLTVFLFIFLSYLVQTNLEFFERFISEGFLGMFTYFMITVIAIVLAPVSSLPLIAIASPLFGTIETAIISSLGWIIGSVIAFYLARKYGVRIIKNLVSLSTLYKFEDKLTKNQKFWFVLFMRLIFPVDLLSYALGLFTKISFKTYFLATLIGILPFAFLYAYIGSLPYYIQPIIFLSIGTILGIIFIIYLLIKKLKISGKMEGK